MAEKTVISIEVEGVTKATNSVRGLKSELKSLIDQQQNVSQGGKLWKALGKEINEVEGKIGDVTDSFKTLQGSGVDRVSSSLGLLKEGFASFDIGKIGIALKGLGSAFKSVLPFALIEGIMYLVENFEELSKGSGVLAKILQGVGAAITWVKNAVTDLIGVTDDSTRALEKQGEAIKKASDIATEKLSAQNAAYDRQIAAIKAAGKSAVEVEKAKQENIIKTNMILAKQIEAYVRAGGELDEEKRKQLAGNLEAIRAARATENLAIVADNKEKASKYKEFLDKQKELRDKAEVQRLLDLQKAKEDEAAIELQSQHAINADKVVNEQLTQDEINAIRAAESAKRYEDELAQIEKLKQLKKQETDASFQIASQSLVATQNLSDTFFAIKMANVKKGSVEEEKAARKQFLLNKSIQISLAVISGVQGVLNALSAKSILPEPFATGLRIANAVAVGTAAAAAVAKISATQFNNTGFASQDLGGAATGGGGTASLPSGGGVPSIAPPPQNTTTFTGNNNNNFNQPIKVYLPETDIKNATNSADKIKAQATF